MGQQSPEKIKKGSSLSSAWWVLLRGKITPVGFLFLTKNTYSWYWETFPGQLLSIVCLATGGDLKQFLLKFLIYLEGIYRSLCVFTYSLHRLSACWSVEKQYLLFSFILNLIFFFLAFGSKQNQQFAGNSEYRMVNICKRGNTRLRRKPVMGLALLELQTKCTGSLREVKGRKHRHYVTWQSSL